LKSLILRRILEIAFVLGILYASWLLIQLSIPYIHFLPGIEFLQTKQLIYHIDWWRWSFYTHVFSSPVVILSGLLQFSRKLQQSYPKIHKRIGWTYIVVVLCISGPSGLIMSFYANGGYPAQISFVLLTSIWMLSTYMAFYRIRRKELEKHVLWSFRSYALTLSAVTLRLYAYFFDVFNVNLPPLETYILLAYLSWIPNLLIVEILRWVGYMKSFTRAI